MTIEQALNTIKGTIIDYDMISNGTIFSLVKSDKGNYSIRQQFRNVYGNYNGCTIVKKLSKVDESMAKIEFADFMDRVRR